MPQGICNIALSFCATSRASLLDFTNFISNLSKPHAEVFFDGNEKGDCKRRCKMFAGNMWFEVIFCFLFKQFIQLILKDKV